MITDKINKCWKEWNKNGNNQLRNHLSMIFNYPFLPLISSLKNVFDKLLESDLFFHLFGNLTADYV